MIVTERDLTKDEIKQLTEEKIKAEGKMLLEKCFTEEQIKNPEIDKEKQTVIHPSGSKSVYYFGEDKPDL